MSVRAGREVAQVWVRVRADDPEAVSALTVARTMAGDGDAPVAMRRFRLLELRGTLPPREELERRLARSIQFYNPQKESVQVRRCAAEPSPLEPGEQAVLVVERGAARRRAAERWWAAETGGRMEVREGVVWALRFAAGVEAAAAAAGLAVVRDRRHGLLCNPHAEDHRLAGEAVPVPWLTRVRAVGGGGR